MILQDYETMNGVLLAVEGIKIGGTKESAGIGETDNPVIRHPVTRLPYIPGSSLKGKLRSLIEWRTRPDCQKSGRPCDCGKCDVCYLFGSNNIRTSESPGRLIFRDAPLLAESEQELRDALPGSFVEDKTEISMDRRIGATYKGSLRQQERVPAGSKFQFAFTMRVFDTDKPKRKGYFELLAQAVDDLENDYLGGCGTRGYGQVKLFGEDGSTPLSKILREKAAAK